MLHINESLNVNMLYKIDVNAYISQYIKLLEQHKEPQSNAKKIIYDEIKSPLKNKDARMVDFNNPSINWDFFTCDHKRN